MVTLHTGSQHVVEGIQDLLPIWRLNGWRRGRNGQSGEVTNPDLWQELAELLDARHVTCKNLRADSGHLLSNRCHALADEAARNMWAKLNEAREPVRRSASRSR